MSPPFGALFFLAAGAWVGALLHAALGATLLERRLGRAQAWRASSATFPLVDLLGAWAGAIAAVAVVLGRSGFSLPFAAILTMLALMFALSLYDRAVLVPYLDAADKRLEHGADREKWESDWKFLSRLATLLRLATLAMGAAVVALGTRI